VRFADKPARLVFAESYSLKGKTPFARFPLWPRFNPPAAAVLDFKRGHSLLSPIAVTARAV
jgi:hypothetical protein